MTPPECPFCGNTNASQIESDGVFCWCSCCSRFWGVDRPIVKPADREQARRRWNDPTEKTKPGGRS
jgi:hypothetical protein